MILNLKRILTLAFLSFGHLLSVENFMLTALMDISSFCLFNPLGLVECLVVNFIDENCVEY